MRFCTGRGRGGHHVATALLWVVDGRIDPSVVVSEIPLFADPPTVLAHPSLNSVLLRQV